MSILNVNQIQPVGSGQTVTISATNIDTGSATVTAGTFSGNLSSSGISTFSDTVNVGAGKSIRLYGATSGYSEIIAAAGSASTTFTLPANGGSASQYLQTDGSGGLSWQTLPAAGLQWGDEEVSLSGSGQLWTGIPADVKQVVVAYQAWSNASTSSWICEIGDSGGLETSGYVNVQSYSGSSSSGSTNASNTSWGMSAFTDPVYISHGVIRITLIEASSNLWECQWLNAVQGTSNGHFWHVGGHKSLSGTLDRVQIRPGTGNFDSGKANLLYLT